MNNEQRILIASPYAWNMPHPVNEHIAELADGLTALREQSEIKNVPLPVVVAPSAGRYARRATRRALRALLQGTPAGEVFTTGGELDLSAAAPGVRRPIEGVHEWPLLAMPVPAGPASVGLRAALRTLIEHGEFDLIHVHDPVVNDLTRYLVKHWSGLTVASYHAPQLHGMSGMLAMPLRERILDGVDRWLVPENAQQVVDAFKEIVGDRINARELPMRTATSEVRGGEGKMIVVGRGVDDDGIIRDLLRDLTTLLDARPELTVTLMSRWHAQHRPITPRLLKGRLLSIHATTREQADSVLAGAGVFISLPSTEQRASDEAAAAGVPILEIEHKWDMDALHIMIENTVDAAAAPVPDFLVTGREIAHAHLDAYHELKERKQVHIKAPSVSNRSCVIDLHMHTSHSWDCATEPAALLHTAREVGLTAVAVTDHNEISGALACAELAHEYGIQVIVGEEVKTAQGEVIGLFLTERIEPGLSWHETLKRIREQDGLVYVPHPFDRLHTIPDSHLLRDTLDDIDAFETYNARLPFDQYNRDAERFARKYNLIEGAGSDAHVVQGLGTAAVHMPGWDDQESFLLALSQGEILKRPKSLLYLQGLKWVNDLTGRSKSIPPEAVGERA